MGAERPAEPAAQPAPAGLLRSVRARPSGHNAEPFRLASRSATLRECWPSRRLDFIGGGGVSLWRSREELRRGIFREAEMHSGGASKCPDRERGREFGSRATRRASSSREKCTGAVPTPVLSVMALLQTPLEDQADIMQPGNNRGRVMLLCRCRSESEADDFGRCKLKPLCHRSHASSKR